VQVFSFLKRDQALQANARHAGPKEQRQMRVAPNVEAPHLFGRVHMALARALEVQPAQEKDECHTAKCSGGGRQRPVLLRADAAHHFGNELAEQNDGQQAVAFRVILILVSVRVSGMWRACKY